MNEQILILQKILKKCKQPNFIITQKKRQSVKFPIESQQILGITTAFCLVSSSRLHLNQFNKNQKKINKQSIFKRRNMYEQIKQQNGLPQKRDSVFLQISKQKQNKIQNKRTNFSLHYKQPLKQIQVQFGNYIRLPQIKQKIQKIYEPRNASLCQNTKLQKTMNSLSLKNAIYQNNKDKKRQSNLHSLWLSNQRAKNNKNIVYDMAKLDLLKRINQQNVKKCLLQKKSNKLIRFFKNLTKDY